MENTLVLTMVPRCGPEDWYYITVNILRCPHFHGTSCAACLSLVSQLEKHSGEDGTQLNADADTKKNKWCEKVRPWGKIKDLTQRKQ